MSDQDKDPHGLDAAADALEKAWADFSTYMNYHPHDQTVHRIAMHIFLLSELQAATIQEFKKLREELRKATTEE